MEFNIEEVVQEVKPQDITVQIIKDYMRIDFDDPENDKMIELMLTSAKSFTQSYLGWKFEDQEDVPNEINIAILSITEHWYKNRGILPENKTIEEIPFVFSGILNLHRNHQVGFSGGGLDYGSIW